MKITMTRDNIDKYCNDRFDEIIKIKWMSEDLDKKVIDNFPNLQILDCYSKITSLEPLTSCINLQKLYCNGSPLASLEPLSNCVNLQILDCSNNPIPTLEPLSNCVNLQILDCHYNKIKTLEPLSNCVNLQILNCNYNLMLTLEPLHNCVNLQKLYCSGNKIASIEPLSNCINLQKLYCNDNKITSLEPLYNCVNLRVFNCNFNQITTLEPLHHCVNLREIYCRGNKISSLEPLSKCVNLQKLLCSHNMIENLQPLYNCINLQYFDCSYNQITSLQALSNCVNLKKLNCSTNRLISLEVLSNCINLKILNCSVNEITSLEPLIYLRRLYYIDYSNNPIEIPTVQIQRMLNRIQSNRNSSIYNDKQNVHDTEIQRTVCESVQNLLKDPKNVFNIDDVINSSLNKSTIESIIEYCQDQTIHSVHLITYQELFLLVWNRIQNTIHKTELMKILEEQIADSECKCFTGRFNRTLSVLVGFFDDIKINISDKSRISAIILNSKDKIIPYESDKHKKLATKELFDAGYLETDFKDWIDAIE